VQEDLGAVIDRWMTDEEFRAAFRRDPEAAVAAAGFVLDKEALDAVHAMDRVPRDHDLHQRVSKGI
jgi:hypothetical protein